MKIKLEKVPKIITALQKIVNKDIPIEIAFSLSEIIDTIDGKSNFYIQENQKIIKKYVEKIEENNRLIFKDEESQQKYIQSVEKLNNIEFEIEFTPFSYKELGKIEFTAIDLYNLKDFIIK